MFSSRTSWNLEPNRLARRRAELEAQGRKLVDLTVSNPTACGLSPQGVALPPVDVYQPEPAGAFPAREAVGAYHRDAVGPERVVLSASTSEAYSWLFKLLCEPGEGVLVATPSYPLVEDLAALEGVRATGFPLRFDGTWHLDPNAVLEAADAGTRAVVLVNPGNPTGTYLEPEPLLQLARACADKGWALIVDEVFGEPERSVAELDLPCLTFALGGLSKAVGLPQLKLAWTLVLGPDAPAKQAVARLEHLADAYLSVAPAVQQGLRPVLAEAANFRSRVAERCRVNRAALAVVRPFNAAWSVLPAEAGWSALVRIPEQPGEEDVCLRALEAGVVVQPGYFFDFPSGAWLVLSLLAPVEEFRAGARLLGTVLQRDAAAPKSTITLSDFSDDDEASRNAPRIHPGPKPPGR